MDGRANLGIALGVLAIMAGCRDRRPERADTSRALAPVYPASPLESTNWDSDAGPLMIVSDADNRERARVVLPEATDSTIESFEGVKPAVDGMKFDLFGRGGSSESVELSLAPAGQTRGQCYGWPRALVKGKVADWRVGFVKGHAYPVRLDSIEGRSSVDSAGLAIALTQTVATLPATNDPMFRGLPFRVRSAYTFRLDSIDVVVADVVRTVNEEANPRIEHVFVIAERAAGTNGRLDSGYSTRTAGSEDSIQATELLAVLQIGSARRPAVVISIEYDDGGNVALVERTGPGRWSLRWKSAYTDC